MRRAVLIAGTAAVLALAGCHSSATASGSAGLATAPAAAGTSPSASPKPAPVVTVTVTATSKTGTGTAPAGTFTDGGNYDVWVIAAHDDGTIVIRLGQHLTGDDAKNYLVQHGATVPPDGIPDDYINVDLGKQYTVAVAPAATVTVNPAGEPKTMTAAQFEAWIPKNLSQPIAAADRDTYAGAAHYFSTMLQVTFTGGVITSINQIFMP